MTRISPSLAASTDRWEVQLRKGVLEFIILLSLDEKEQYGFELISGVARRAALGVPEGTLYPLLLRLAKEQLVASRPGAGEGGAPRKYYSLTDSGRALLGAMRARWTTLGQSVEAMLLQGDEA